MIPLWQKMDFFTSDFFIFFFFGVKLENEIHLLFIFSKMKKLR